MNKTRTQGAQNLRIPDHGDIAGVGFPSPLSIARRFTADFEMQRCRFAINVIGAQKVGARTVAQ